jgi:hypothetical protein
MSILQKFAHLQSMLVDLEAPQQVPAKLTSFEAHMDWCDLRNAEPFMHGLPITWMQQYAVKHDKDGARAAVGRVCM